MPLIEWRHQRRSLLLRIAILPSLNAANSTDMVEIEGLIDTGATTTNIRMDVAERLRLKPKGRRRIFTANGDILANEYLFRVGFFTDPTAQLPFVLEQEILGADLNANFSYAALIGMDIIGSSDFHVGRDGTASLRLY
jgi:hypothetical protein